MKKAQFIVESGFFDIEILADLLLLDRQFFLDPG